MSTVFTNKYSGLSQGPLEVQSSSVINAVCGDSSLLIGDVVKILPVGSGVGFTQLTDILPRVGRVDTDEDNAYGVIVGGDLEGIYNDITTDIIPGSVVSFFGGGVRVCTQGRCVARIFPENNNINIGDALTINTTNSSLQSITDTGERIIARALQFLPQNDIVEDVTFAAVDIQREGFFVSPFIQATGGTITFDGDFKIHTFSTSGTFEITANPQNESMDILLLAGGAGGGGMTNLNNGAGGGGAGEYYTDTITRGVDSYTVTVGAAGAGGAAGNNIGSNGSDSVFDDLTVFGGGGGGSVVLDGSDGGSGGGGSSFSGGSSTAVLGLGNDGGDGSTSSGFGAGGGGATQVGEDAQATIGGDGGDGATSSITGTAITRAGGGGGGNTSGAGGTGGTGGGGDGGASPSAGDDATGFGAGGGGASSTTVSGSFKGGDGSDGVVILRYQFQ